MARKISEKIPGKVSAKTSGNTPEDAAGDVHDCDPQVAAELLRALAHPMRLTILRHLLDGETAVSVFEERLGLRQPSLSQQLAHLREAGLVATRRLSKSMIYRLTDPRVRPVLEVLRTVLDPAALSGPYVLSGSDTPRVGIPAGATPSTLPPAGSRDAAAATVPAMTPACGVFSSAGWPGS